MTRKEYLRDYYKKNREKCIASTKRWKENNLEKVKEIKRNDYEKHKEEYKKKSKLWRENNLKRYMDWQKKYHHSEKYLSRKRELTHILRLKILHLLGDKCVKCGFLDWRTLQIDHIKGHGINEFKIFGRGDKYNRHILEKIQSGSKDYQLLCANCNWIKRYENNESGLGTPKHV
jgi:hypothetical protein